jgi:hypothetical protein
MSHNDKFVILNQGCFPFILPIRAVIAFQQGLFATRGQIPHKRLWKSSAGIHNDHYEWGDTSLTTLPFISA